MNDQTHDIAGVLAPPPLIYASGIALGLLLNRLWPLPWLPPTVNRPLGAALAVLGSVPAAWAFVEMTRARTNVDPHKPTTAIVASGPYRWTRNPIYLSFAAITAGVAVWANALWVLLALPAVLMIMVRGVIEREERYLERKFGDEYREYKSRVRRWL